MIYSCVCVLILLSSWKQVIACSQDGPCRELAFPSFLFFADKVLVNHTIKTVQVGDLDGCEALCYFEHNCVSINFENKASEKEKFNCELNNSTHAEHEENLVEAKNYFYRGTENACGKSPCKNGGTCQSGFTKKRYRCLCPSGFIGCNCENDIDECVQGSHDCLPSLASCTNTAGSFSCSCNAGYVGDGKTSCQLPQECQNYQSLNTADRKVTHGVTYPRQSDREIGPGWFRFEGSAGTRMATSCPPINKCDTSATGWMNGGHPTVADGQVSRTVCFHWRSGCCERRTSIKVRNCDSFFVYYLSNTPAGRPRRYCGTD